MQTNIETRLSSRPFPHSSPEGGLKCPLTARIERAYFLVCAFCEQEGHSGYPLYPPGAADLNVRAINVAGLIAQEIADGCHRIVDSADVAGRDAFGHAGEFSWRRTA